MFLRIILLLILIVIWIGLAGVPEEFYLIFFILLAPMFSFFIAFKLGVLPVKNVFRIQSIFYCFWLLKEIFMSSIAVVKIACRKNLGIKPDLSAIKSIQTNDIGLVVYANSITLTPGTVTLSTEGNILLVHAFDVSFMDDLQSGEMDNRVKKIIC